MMLKKGFWTFLLMFVTLQAHAQNIRIKVIGRNSNGRYVIKEPYSENHSPVLVSLNNRSVEFKNTELKISNIKSYSLSPDHTLFSFLTLKNDSLKLFTAEIPGNKLITINSSGYDQKDPSLKTYTLNNGKTIVRSNIAHFDLYNQSGKLQNTVSNAAGSTKGESISKLAINPNGTLILAYNPKIYFQNVVQSRIQKINFKTGIAKPFFYSNSMSIQKVQFSRDGQFVLATLKKGGQSKLIIMDRFGNVIRSFSFHYLPTSIVMTENDQYVTVTYKNEINVYDVINGHDIGGTSLRSYLIYGTYEPIDRMVVGVAGNYHSESHRITNIKIYGVDLKARKLGNSEFIKSLKWVKNKFNLKVVRLGIHHYEIKGFSSPIVAYFDF